MVPLPPRTPPTGPELTRITCAAAILLLLGSEQGGGVRPIIDEFRTNDLVYLGQAAAAGFLYAGKESSEIKTEIIAALQDPSANAGAFACMTLGYISGMGSLAIPILTNLIQRSNPEVPRYAIQALREFGARHPATIPVLLQALTNANSSKGLRISILSELYLFRSLPTEAVPTLQNLTENPDPAIAAWANRALSNVRSNNTGLS